MHRSIPVASQLIIQPQQSDRAPSHFQGGDVAAYQRTSNSDIFAAQNLCEFIGNDIELDQ